MDPATSMVIPDTTYAQFPTPPYRLQTKAITLVTTLIAQDIKR